MKKILFILLVIPRLAFSQLDTVNNGTAAGAGNGEILYSAFQKVNDAINLLNDIADTIDSAPVLAGDTTYAWVYDSSMKHKMRAPLVDDESMVYPGAGIPLSTGSAWGTSITNNSTNWNTAYTNRISTFTTTGNSGAATFSSNTLNIPTYTLAGLGGITLTSLSSTATGLTYTNTTGVFSLTSGYSIPTTTKQTEWDNSKTRTDSIITELSDSVELRSVVHMRDSAIVQNVQNGSKVASFTHDGAISNVGAYALSTSGAVTISIHNLESGSQGTIFLAITTNPSGITINTFSDAGSTGLTEVQLGSNIANAGSKSTSITYTCVNNGSNTLVYLNYGQQP